MKKAVFVAIAGEPNVGKSTLLNKLIGTKISIVSPKVQTTRTTIHGIYNEEDTQIIFVDTPGIFEAKRTLEEAIVSTAWAGLEGIDLVLLLVDSVKGITPNNKQIIERLNKKGIKPILLINKIDLITKEKLKRLTSECEEKFDFTKIIKISAIQGDGLKELISYIKQEAPEHEWYFPDGEITTASSRLIASEITREKLFLNLSEELPYNLTVETETWEELKDGSVKIRQAIFVARETHKQIVIGKNGQSIKKIGQLAREEIEKLLGFKVHLFLFVKIREKWFNDPARYEYLGMKAPKKKK